MSPEERIGKTIVGRLHETHDQPELTERIYSMMLS